MTAWQIIYILILILRITSAVMLPFAPMVAWVICLISDTVDNNIAIRAGITYLNYQLIDKLLDFVFRLFIVIAAYYLSWPVAGLFLGLLIYRSLGELLIVTQDYFHRQKWFVVFPNVLDALFILYLLYSQGNLHLPWELLLIVGIMVKIAYEYVLHVAHWSDPLTVATVKRYPGYGKPAA